MRRLLCQYLATLPATNSHEQTCWANVPQVVDGQKVVKFGKKMATPLAKALLSAGRCIEVTMLSE